MEEFGRAASLRRSLDSYRRFLEDPQRLALYRRAIRQVVRSGAIVADAGAGLGVLAAIAVRSGARVVLALDDPPLAGPGRAVVAENGLDDHIIYLRPGARVEPARRKADVLILESLGDCVFETGFLGTARAARRHLKRGAITIPARVDVLVAPVRDPYFHDVVGSALGARRHGLTFSAAMVGAVDRVYKKWIYPSDFLAPARRVARIDLAGFVVPRLSMSAEFRVPSRGTLTGFGLWTDIWFTRQVVARTLSARPWQNLFFPIEVPTQVGGSDTISVAFDLREHEGRIRWRWNGWVGRGPSRRVFSHGA